MIKIISNINKFFLFVPIMTLMLISCSGESLSDSNQKNIVKEIAITIDDLPIVGSWQMTKLEQKIAFYRVLQTFKKYNIKAYGFVNGKTIQSHHLAYLDSFYNNGHKLDNHTFSHPNLNKTKNSDFIIDIMRGEKSIAKWQKSPKYFRYPFLVRGKTIKKRFEIEAFLKRKNYIIVPVTIDTSDWKFNAEFMKAKKVNDSKKLKDIGAKYLKHVKDQTKLSMNLSDKNLKRQIRHTLLIHMNQLNAEYLDNVLNWYRNSGWKFVTLERTLKDSVYSQKERYVGEWGVTWLKMLY